MWRLRPRGLATPMALARASYLTLQYGYRGTGTRQAFILVSDPPGSARIAPPMRSAQRIASRPEAGLAQSCVRIEDGQYDRSTALA